MEGRFDYQMPTAISAVKYGILVGLFLIVGLYCGIDPFKHSANFDFPDFEAYKVPGVVGARGTQVLEEQIANPSRDESVDVPEEAKTSTEGPVKALQENSIKGRLTEIRFLIRSGVRNCLELKRLFLY
ncbi:hypothetical protein NE237_003660 [Protea cynaroides]|uniref:Uncharacterized protein n=1 Tax=Protea cynaroides TaxID=273540 RepID=A0A9Q0KHS5_9MAGN|nr:hypothetical protein NE237_003660 [Protea cynaroides]